MDIFDLRRERIAAGIEAAMKAAGLNRKQFAARMGRQPSEVTKWLGGKHNFTIDLLTEIAEKLNDGSIADSAASIVCGYNDVIPGGDNDVYAGMLRDSAASAVHNDSCRISLPSGVWARLELKAALRGLTKEQYACDVLVAEAEKTAFSDAFKYCGIWRDDEYPDASEIVSILEKARTIKPTVEL